MQRGALEAREKVLKQVSITVPVRLETPNMRFWV
jgi:hypothetical protein